MREDSVQLRLGDARFDGSNVNLLGFDAHPVGRELNWLSAVVHEG